MRQFGEYQDWLQLSIDFNEAKSRRNRLYKLI